MPLYRFYINVHYPGKPRVDGKTPQKRIYRYPVVAKTRAGAMKQFLRHEYDPSIGDLVALSCSHDPIPIRKDLKKKARRRKRREREKRNTHIMDPETKKFMTTLEWEEKTGESWEDEQKRRRKEARKKFDWSGHHESS